MNGYVYVWAELALAFLIFLFGVAMSFVIGAWALLALLPYTTAIWFAAMIYNNERTGATRKL